MKLPRINAESIWYSPTDTRASEAAWNARKQGYQFFIYGAVLYLNCYWRDSDYPDFLPLDDIEPSEIERFKAEIEALG